MDKAEKLICKFADEMANKHWDNAKEDWENLTDLPTKVIHKNQNQITLF